MNLARRNSQFLGFTQSLLDNDRAEHEAWLRQVEECSAELEAWGKREAELRQAAVPQLLQGEKDWDGSESNLVGISNGEVGE